MKELWREFSSAVVNLIMSLASPFISVAVLIDESRRQNLDGSWYEYWECKNRRARRREQRRARKFRPRAHGKITATKRAAVQPNRATQRKKRHDGSKRRQEET